MDPGDQLLDVGVLDDQPVVAVAVLGLVEPAGVVHGQQLDHFGLHVLESLTRRWLEADPGLTGADQPGRTLEGDRCRRQGEQGVEVRLDRLGPAEQGVEQPHQVNTIRSTPSDQHHQVNTIRPAPPTGALEPDPDPDPEPDHEGRPSSASMEAS